MLHMVSNPRYPRKFKSAACAALSRAPDVCRTLSGVRLKRSRTFCNAFPSRAARRKKRVRAPCPVCLARAFRARSATRAGNWIWHGGDNRRDSAALAACRFFGNRSAYAGDRRLIAADRCPCTEQYPHHCARCRAGHRTDDRGREPGWRAFFFPDPWPKARHHKRRLIQPAFVARLAARLAPGAYLHCATDWQDYAEHMLAVLSAQPSLENTAPGYTPRPAYRPVTKFEARGRQRGHGIWDLVFRKKPAGRLTPIYHIECSPNQDSLRV